MAMQTLAVLFTAAAAASAHFNVERQILGHEAWALVERLPEVKKKVIMFIYRDEMSISAVARELHCKYSVAGRLHRDAINDLRKTMLRK